MSFEHLRDGQNELVLHVNPEPPLKVCNCISVSDDLLCHHCVGLVELLIFRIRIIDHLCA